METNVILIGSVIIFLVVIGFILIREDRNKSRLSQQMYELSEMAQQLAKEQAQNSVTAQAELKGRMEQSQTSVNERFEALSKRIGDGLVQQTEKTGITLKQLHERLAVIDTAQKNITGLSEQMVGLQDILSNKQARGAFGEIQLKDLVSSILPPSAYSFQVTMTNNKRADCVLDLPNPPGPIVIDSKFPLESYHLLRNADGDVEQKVALRALGAAIIKHIQDMAN